MAAERGGLSCEECMATCASAADVLVHRSAKALIDHFKKQHRGELLPPGETREPSSSRVMEQLEKAGYGVCICNGVYKRNLSNGRLHGHQCAAAAATTTQLLEAAVQAAAACPANEQGEGEKAEGKSAEGADEAGGNAVGEGAGAGAPAKRGRKHPRGTPLEGESPLQQPTRRGRGKQADSDSDYVPPDADEVEHGRRGPAPATGGEERGRGAGDAALNVDTPPPPDFSPLDRTQTPPPPQQQQRTPPQQQQQQRTPPQQPLTPLPPLPPPPAQQPQPPQQQQEPPPQEDNVHEDQYCITGRTPQEWRKEAIGRLRKAHEGLKDLKGPASKEQCDLLLFVLCSGSNLTKRKLKESEQERGKEPRETRVGDEDGWQGATQQPTPATQHKRNVNDAVGLVNDGLYARASRILSSKGLSQLDRGPVKASLEAKYPSRTSVCPDVAGLAPGCVGADVRPFSEDEVLNYINSRGKRCAAGPGGLSYDDMKNLINEGNKRGTKDPTILSCITLLISLIAAGRFNSDERTARFLASAHGVALSKSSDAESTAVRPIAVSIALVRAAGGLLVKRHHTELRALEGRRQLGAEQGGAEIVYHFINTALYENKTWAVASLDATNAFNSIDKAALLEAATRVPGLLPYADLTIGRAHDVIYSHRGNKGDNFRIVAQEGGPQGNPVMPRLYGVATSPAADWAVATYGKDIVQYTIFADNAYFLGPPEDALAVSNAYRDKLKEDLGLIIGKAELFATRRRLPEEVRTAALEKGMTVEQEGIIVMGVPLGIPKYVKANAQRLIEEATRGASTDAMEMYSASTDGASLQNILNHYRYQVPARVNHILRSIDPNHFDDGFLERMDKIVAMTVIDIVGAKPAFDNISNSDPGRAQAIQGTVLMAANNGGMGFRKMTLTADAAYMGGFAASAEAVRKLLSLDAVQEGDPAPQWMAAYDDLHKSLREVHGHNEEFAKLLDQCAPLEIAEHSVPGLQHGIADFLADGYRKALERETLNRPAKTLDERARRDMFVAAGDSKNGGALTGAWVTVHGNWRGCRLHDLAYEAATRARLGLPAEGVPDSPTCACGKPADAMGSHAHVCGKLQGARNTRHRQIVHAVESIARGAGLPIQHEPFLADFYKQPDQATLTAEQQERLATLKTRADAAITLTNNIGGRPVLVDVVVTASTSGAAGAQPISRDDVQRRLKVAEEAKIKHYTGSWDIADPRRALVPFALDVAGNPGKRAMDFINDMLQDSAVGNEHADEVSGVVSGRKRHAWAMISVALQTMNFAALGRWKVSCMGLTAPVGAGTAAPPAAANTGGGRGGRGGRGGNGGAVTRGGRGGRGTRRGGA